jgi:hypothetical protein
MTSVTDQNKTKKEEKMNSEVTSVQMTVTLSDGTERSFRLVNPGALFFNGKMVDKVLAPFYDDEANRYNLTKDEGIRVFGKDIAEKLFGDKNQLKVTGDVIRQTWVYLKEEGTRPAIIEKMPACPIGIPVTLKVVPKTVTTKKDSGLTTENTISAQVFGSSVYN